MIFLTSPDIEINGIKLTAVRDVALHVEVEQIDVTPSIIVEPDPKWTFRDSCGHFHAFSDAESNDPLPTLRRQETEEGSYDEDEGDTWTKVTVWYECRICDAKVEPKWIESIPTYREYATGRKRWRFEVTVPNGTPLPRKGDFCTVRVFEPEHEFFGVGIVAGGPGYSGMGSMIRVTIHGSGPLGRRTRADA